MPKESNVLEFGASFKTMKVPLENKIKLCIAYVKPTFKLF